MHQYVMNDDVKQPNSADQQQTKAKFTARAKAAATWWNANKPSTSNANGTADYLKVMAAYDAQHQYGNPYIFVRTLVAGTVPAVQVPGATTSGGTTTGGGGNPSSD